MSPVASLPRPRVTPPRVSVEDASVLLVKVCVAAIRAKVSVAAGRVTDEVPCVTMVVVFAPVNDTAPAVLNAPPKVAVLLPLLTPVPPLADGVMPLTSVVSTTGPYDGAPPALPCSTVVVVPSDPRPWTVKPPLPITIWFAVMPLVVMHVAQLVVAHAVVPLPI